MQDVSGCRDQLSLCTQKIEIKKTGSSAHKGGHSTVSLEGNMASHIHRRKSHTHTCFNVQVRSTSKICLDSRVTHRDIRYYHRPLNISKLIDVQFTYVPRNMTLTRMIRLNKLPETPHLAQPGYGLREMEDRDIPQVAELYTRYMERFTMCPILTLEEARHQFLSGKGEGPAPEDWTGRREKQVVWSYVVEVSFVSYFHSCLSSVTESRDKENYGLLHVLFPPVHYFEES